ncbi:aldehyde dehydrogenase family protein [Actinospica robiniae]|uniref:aldehyde dehydrogenase family protein n=1 Tax=Actinospica robiniae TaxID=304901 RepID=UPI00040D1C3D|nr:aldehyde dehydrogenase family protein [Actinospica robiniae]
MDGTVIVTDGLDRDLAELRRGAHFWAATSIDERIGLLERMLPRIRSGAEETAAASARAKGYGADSPWAAEDWAGGPWALAQNVSAYSRVLRTIATGRGPLDASAVRESEGRTWVDVFPASGWDRLLLSGFSARVRMRGAVGVEQTLARAAGEYRGRPGKPAVALVLGAGNVAAITALDVLHKLFVEGQVVIAKMNPVNAYLRPHFERVFAEFIDRDWVRFADGGAHVGSYLAAHADVDTLHITGSERSHDAIVWGIDGQAGRRRREDDPLLDKPFSSELGGVSPCIVVPGKWSPADFRFQAEHIVTSKMNNSGHNCIASQILILPREWDGTERLLDEIRGVLRDLPPRHDYYPGAESRLAAVRDAHPHAECWAAGSRLLIPNVADHDDILLTEEVFASALGVVRLAGGSTADFLRNAVEFANTKLPGTLGATVIVHPRTENAARNALSWAIAELRYGTVGVNCWSAIGFLLGYTPWGAYPGHTRQAIGSGIGFVHNAFMLEDIEKTVLRAPFAPAPRGLVSGSPSLSPRPPYFVTNRTGLATIRHMTDFTAAPRIGKLPAVFASALRG